MRATIRTLAASAAELGVTLDDAAVARFAAYYQLLTRWNARMNLTRIIDEPDVVAKHFLDSLALVPYLGGAKTLIDVGTGAGFPGAVAAIARPGLAVTLVESIKKKCTFLEALGRELGLDLRILPQRVEEISAPYAWFDVAVSRATFPPPRWVEVGAPLVAPGGILVAMLGRERPDLTAPAGFLPPELFPYVLPVEGARALAILRRSLQPATTASP